MPWKTQNTNQSACPQMRSLRVCGSGIAIVALLKIALALVRWPKLTVAASGRHQMMELEYEKFV
jgi:hypothetical protein